MSPDEVVKKTRARWPGAEHGPKNRAKICKFGLAGLSCGGLVLLDQTTSKPPWQSWNEGGRGWRLLDPSPWGRSTP
jgi:hypothetical protein